MRNQIVESVASRLTSAYQVQTPDELHAIIKNQQNGYDLYSQEDRAISLFDLITQGESSLEDQLNWHYTNHQAERSLDEAIPLLATIVGYLLGGVHANDLVLFSEFATFVQASDNRGLDVLMHSQPVRGLFTFFQDPETDKGQAILAYYQG